MKGTPKTPLLTVDIVIELRDKPGHPIVLIERKNPPFGWAIPGGFVDVGESTEAAARREAREETSLVVEFPELLGVYSDPQRDPRGHTVSVAYVARARGNPVAMDDAKTVRAFEIDELPKDMAFDHAKILKDYLTIYR